MKLWTLLALAIPFAACHREKRIVHLDEDIAGIGSPWTMKPPARFADAPPKDKKLRDAEEARRAAERLLIIDESQRRIKARDAERGRVRPAVAVAGEPMDESVVRSSGTASAPAGENAAQGDPRVRRPENLRALPAAGPAKYFSPADLKRAALEHRAPKELRRPADASVTAVSGQAPASGPGFSPAPTGNLPDRIPETGVADPNAIGSYHVQVSSSADFKKPFFDRVYPFMAEVTIEKDLFARGTEPGEYWIRFSLVDLLEFEHPYSPPMRLRFPDPR